MSSTRTIEVDRLKEALNESLDVFEQNVIEGINKEVISVSKEARDIIKSKAPKSRTGKKKYYKSIKTKLDESGFNTKAYVFSARPHYRLTHLLENGHAIMSGSVRVGTTKAQPHWKYGNDYVVKELPKRVKNIVSKYRR